VKRGFRLFRVFRKVECPEAAWGQAAPPRRIFIRARRTMRTRAWNIRLGLRVSREHRLFSALGAPASGLAYDARGAGFRNPYVGQLACERSGGSDHFASSVRSSALKRRGVKPLHLGALHSRAMNDANACHGTFGSVSRVSREHHLFSAL
jgi:hypothetical protein